MELLVVILSGLGEEQASDQEYLLWYYTTEDYYILFDVNILFILRKHCLYLPEISCI